MDDCNSEWLPHPTNKGNQRAVHREWKENDVGCGPDEGR